MPLDDVGRHLQNQNHEITIFSAPGAFFKFFTIKIAALVETGGAPVDNCCICLFVALMVLHLFVDGVAFVC